MPDADYWELWCQVYPLYRITLGITVSCTEARLSNIIGLLSQLIDNTDINEVTFVTVGLASKVT